MLDIKFIKENKDLVLEGAKKKNIEVDIDALLGLDEKRVSITQEVEEIRARQNKVSEEIAKNPENKDDLIMEMQKVKEGLVDKERELKEVMKEWRELMLQVPNIPDMSVPEGETEEENQEIRTWGDKPEFSFEPRNQIELARLHDGVDFDRGAKVSGFRGYFLKNDFAKLSFALWQLAMDELSAKGFTPMIVPSLARKEPFIGTGFLPQSEEDLYKTQDGEYLAGTGEVATMGYYMDEAVDEKDLPIKFLSFSPCFRREAGSHGRDTKGLIRVHEFFKMEQVILCEASHETSVKLHEELTENSEKLMQLLGIPYRVVVCCGGETGLGHVKKYDIEAWVPSEGKYRETHSSSYFHDFQTRRLNIRYRDKDGKLRFVHSLNNTAFATPRLLVPIIENYQKENGDIEVPAVLRKYIGKDVIEKK